MSTSLAAVLLWLFVVKIVEALKATRGRFEHNDLPEATRNGEVHVAGTTRVAMCKDPEGNILALVNQ